MPDQLAWVSHFTKYTPLNTNFVRILEEALNVKLIPISSKTSAPPNADQNKQYQYHRNFGYSTKECPALKDKIEEIIQVGHLRCFVQREMKGMRWH